MLHRPPRSRRCSSLAATGLAYVVTQMFSMRVLISIISGAYNTIGTTPGYFTSVVCWRPEFSGAGFGLYPCPDGHRVSRRCRETELSCGVEGLPEVSHAVRVEPGQVRTHAPKNHKVPHSGPYGIGRSIGPPVGPWVKGGLTAGKTCVQSKISGEYVYP